MFAKPFIHLIESPAGKYVFDVNTDDVFRVDDECYQLLREISMTKRPTEDYTKDDHLQPFIVQGYLSSNKVKTIEHSAAADLQDYLDRSLSMITLQLTQNCNLRCSYCIYSDFNNKQQRSHANNNMSFNTAVQAVDFLIKHSIDSQKVAIGFYGGEPMLRFDLIKKIIEYKNEQYPEKDIHYTITTNGTLFNDENVAFLANNGVDVMVSLDGPEKVQNIHRRFAKNGEGSYQTIAKNLRQIIEYNKTAPKPLEFSLNMVMDPQYDYESICLLYKDIPELIHYRIRSTVVDDSFSTSKSNFSTEYVEQNSYDTFLGLLEHFELVDGLKTPPHTMNTIQAEYSKIQNRTRRASLPETFAPGGPCIPGQRRLFIDVNGNFYPCERVSENSPVMRIGNLIDGFDINKCDVLLNVGKLTAESCRNCWAFNRCTICARSCDAGDHLSGQLKATHCHGTKNSAEQGLLYEILKYDIEQTKLRRL